MNPAIDEHELCRIIASLPVRECSDCNTAGCSKCAGTGYIFDAGGKPRGVAGMTNEEIREEARRLAAARNRASQEIVNHVRPIISVLQDHGMPKAADDLRELYFQLDAVEQEMAKLVMSDPKQFLNAMIEDLGRK